jgi:hypothetical protein
VVQRCGHPAHSATRQRAGCCWQCCMPDPSHSVARWVQRLDLPGRVCRGRWRPTAALRAPWPLSSARAPRPGHACPQTPPARHSTVAVWLSSVWPLADPWSWNSHALLGTPLLGLARPLGAGGAAAGPIPWRQCAPPPRRSPHSGCSTRESLLLARHWVAVPSHSQASGCLCSQ